MKHLTHQIIALLLAFAGHCALLPSVLAETESLTVTAADGIATPCARVAVTFPLYLTQ